MIEFQTKYAVKKSDLLDHCSTTEKTFQASKIFDISKNIPSFNCNAIKTAYKAIEAMNKAQQQDLLHDFEVKMQNKKTLSADQKRHFIEWKQADLKKSHPNTIADVKLLIDDNKKPYLFIGIPYKYWQKKSDVKKINPNDSNDSAHIIPAKSPISFDNEYIIAKNGFQPVENTPLNYMNPKHIAMVNPITKTPDSFKLIEFQTTKKIAPKELSSLCADIKGLSAMQFEKNSEIGVYPCKDIKAVSKAIKQLSNVKNPEVVLDYAPAQPLRISLKNADWEGYVAPHIFEDFTNKDLYEV